MFPVFGNLKEGKISTKRIPVFGGGNENLEIKQIAQKKCEKILRFGTKSPSIRTAISGAKENRWHGQPAAATQALREQAFSDPDITCVGFDLYPYLCRTHYVPGTSYRVSKQKKGHRTAIHVHRRSIAGPDWIDRFLI